MRNAARAVHRWLGALFLLGVVAQFFLAGLGVFGNQDEAASGGTTVTKQAFDNSFGPHVALGDILVVLSVALVAAALAARLAGMALRSTLAVLLLAIAGAALANAGPPAVRALHPVVGLGVLGAAGYLAYLVGVPWLWRGRRDDR